MNRGLYSAVSAMLANLARQSVLTHNIANLDTPGFKQLMLSLQDFMSVPVASQAGAQQRTPVHQSEGLIRLLNMTEPSVVGSLGLGVETAPERTDFTGGSLAFTGQPLDLAIQGNGFFRLSTPEGERFTRDGRLSRDVDGRLVSVDGYALLDANGNEILLPDGIPTVTPEGEIIVNGATIATLELTVFEDPSSELERGEGNCFLALSQPTGTDRGTIHQGYLEDSNANLVELMTRMVAVGRAYEAAQQLVKVQDELLGKAISTLARI